MALVYTLLPNDTYEITEVSCHVGDLVIPSVYLSKPVTSIGTRAFKNCATLTNVTIPDPIISINSEAFAFCTNLQSINMNDNILGIGIQAFQNCSSLTMVNISRSLNGISFGLFGNCINLKNIYIPKNINSIGGSAFFGCTSLTRINFAGDAPTFGSSLFINTPLNLKLYRYSNKFGWSSSLQGKSIELIDNNIEGLNTFGFPPFSNGRISVNKISGGGRIILNKNA